MNNLVVQQSKLPNTLEDLSNFVLVGREKLTAVRAEIRAINKLQLAEDVREQKKEEAQMLAEALLDAEVRIGDLLKQIPKASGGDRKSRKFKNDTNVDFERTIDTGVAKLETKKEAIERLGFNQKQAERFETLSSNKEIVEQVKAEARENEDIPTRSRVLQLVKEKSKEEQYIEQEFRKIEEETAIQKNIHNAIYKILCTDISEEYLEVWYEGLDRNYLETLENDMDRAIEQYQKIKEFIKEKRKIRRIK